MGKRKEKYARLQKHEIDLLDYYPLINKIMHRLARRYGQYVFDHEESLKQEAFIALKKAYDKYDPERGTFVTLAWIRIDTHMTRLLNKASEIYCKTNHFEDLKFPSESGTKLTWEDIFPSNQIDIQAVARLACKDNIDWKILTGLSKGEIKRTLPNYLGLTREETERRYQLLRDEMVAVTNELYEGNNKK